MATPEFTFNGKTFDQLQAEFVDNFDDAAVDRWHDGVLDALRGKVKASEDPDYLEGFAHGVNERRVRVVMPRRPEGYYHMPLGTFE